MQKVIKLKILIFIDTIQIQINDVYINKTIKEHYIFDLIKHFYSSLTLFAIISDFYNMLNRK